MYPKMLFKRISTRISFRIEGAA